MSLSATPSLSEPRPQPSRDRRRTARAIVAVVPEHRSADAHDQLVDALPGTPIRTWSEIAAAGVIDEVAHLDLVRFALRGALVGGAVLGSVTCVMAVAAAEQPVAVGAGLGAAVALTGGSFLGSLMGFFLAALRWEEAHATVRTHSRAGGSSGVLVVEGDFDDARARQVFDDHGATVVDTSATRLSPS